MDNTILMILSCYQGEMYVVSNFLSLSPTFLLSLSELIYVSIERWHCPNVIPGTFCGGFVTNKTQQVPKSWQLKWWRYHICYEKRCFIKVLQIVILNMMLISSLTFYLEGFVTVHDIVNTQRWQLKGNVWNILQQNMILSYTFKMRQDYLSTSYLNQKYFPSERSETREIWIDPSNVCWDYLVSLWKHIMIFFSHLSQFNMKYRENMRNLVKVEHGC